MITIDPNEVYDALNARLTTVEANTYNALDVMTAKANIVDVHRVYTELNELENRVCTLEIEKQVCEPEWQKEAFIQYMKTTFDKIRDLFIAHMESGDFDISDEEFFRVVFDRC